MISYNAYYEACIRVLNKYKIVLSKDLQRRVGRRESRFRLSSNESNSSPTEKNEEEEDQENKTILYYLNKEAEEKSMIKKSNAFQDNNSSDSSEEKEKVFSFDKNKRGVLNLKRRR